MAFIWGFLFELPADVLNKKKLNILIAKYEAEHPESIKEEVKDNNCQLKEKQE